MDLSLLPSIPAPALAPVALVLLTAPAIGKILVDQRRRLANLPPAVPGLPLIGNLHQLKEKKPHLTFSRWSDTYGPIYSIRTGATGMVVLNSTELAKEAMVTKHSSISTRKLNMSLTAFSSNKAMVATSDYSDYHKLVKRYIVSSILGSAPQKRQQVAREAMLENVLTYLRSHIKDEPGRMVILRERFQMELFRMGMKQAIGKHVKSIFVEELGAEISEREMFEILVEDPMIGALEFDWRDFFPYLRWVPNQRLEKKIMRLATRKMVLAKALINDQKKRIESGEAVECYLDYILSQDDNLTEEQIATLIWEAIIEASDTTMVTVEWAMYELAKNMDNQEKLYQEILEVCGTERLTQEHIPRIPYLSAVFHETLRRHSPVPVIPLRYVYEDVQLGGYNIPSGTEIAINLYGCNMNKEDWDMPEQWNPERFLSEKYDPRDLYNTMAFGAGKRACTGALQAMLISCAAIGRLVQEFQWRLKEGQEEDVLTLQLTNYKLHPMQAHITPRPS